MLPGEQDSHLKYRSEKGSLSGSPPACPSLLQGLFVQVLQRAPEVTICLRGTRITNLCPKALGTFAGKCEGAAGVETETVPVQLREPTLGFGRSTQAAGDTQPCTGARPQQLSPSLPHTGAAQPFHTGLLGWDGAEAGALTPHLLQFPLPVRTTDAFAMFLILEEGLVCLPSVPGLQSAGRVGQSHLHGTAQSCLKPPLLT